MDRLIPGHDGGGVYANINKSKKNTIRLAALLHDGIADALAAGVDAA
jgi:HD superfamily phosphohydrolase